MNREIKFRARDKETKKLCEGLTLEGMFAHYENNSVILEQFTGLYDSAGLEIYEGDIVKSCNKNPDYDTWDNLFAVVFISNKYGTIFQDKDEKMIWDWDNEDSMYSIKFCKIIGNIYDNPELLEGKV